LTPGPATDHVWDAVQDAAGLGMPTAAGRAWPQEVRFLRLRDIARWNDARSSADGWGSMRTW
jgi:hypothetical protein